MKKNRISTTKDVKDDIYMEETLSGKHESSATTPTDAIEETDLQNDNPSVPYNMEYHYESNGGFEYVTLKINVNEQISLKKFYPLSEGINSESFSLKIDEKAIHLKDKTQQLSINLTQTG
ncbi:hypothetical protein FMM80_10230 [Schaedlerella arabinosiphila]|uniref:Uncharacterized protein n=1 Tax=Schaedlerella arabinosiphila TaxID=2044587 RepID=A0A9X5H4P8_9FIRM|nr:hypothetical protein [Schaedlerella arabinosiphila]KAI4440060.1 hypothetical protein C824_002549 [Schaedlerella arabinosiphila]NDO69037.1 hypothetical protein [Schaedlerella arabinosiphila]